MATKGVPVLVFCQYDLAFAQLGRMPFAGRGLPAAVCAR